MAHYLYAHKPLIMRILLKNIRELTLAGDKRKIAHAYLFTRDGSPDSFGTMETWPGIDDWSDLEVIECEGKDVIVQQGHIELTDTEGNTLQVITDGKTN